VSTSLNATQHYKLFNGLLFCNYFSTAVTFVFYVPLHVFLRLGPNKYVRNKLVEIAGFGVLGTIEADEMICHYFSNTKLRNG
jgi:hypothetical protein